MTEPTEKTAPQKPNCCVSGCSNRADIVKKQLCNKHYLRLSRHGDVSAVLRTANNVASDWALSHANHDGDDCLIWPFSKNNNGYAVVWINKKRWLVHRYYCTQEHGPAPSPTHHAAHNCGNGHLGCVNPRHVVWKNPVENAKDKAAHGTLLKGEDHPGAKANAAIVKFIRSSPETGCALAQSLGLSECLISLVRNKKRWADVE